MRFLSTTILLIAVHVAPSFTAAQRSFVFGEVHTLRSAVLQQDRVLNVHLPEGYSPDSAATYPVIYVLDGSAHEDFPHLAGLAQFMNMYALLPKSIVVGIANVDRYHDFTHETHGDSDLVWLPTGGGSASFIRFIAEEVQPYVGEHFRTNGHHTLVGQSLGGLLTLEILIARPELFDDWVAVSPSLWWDNGSLSHKARAWCASHGSDAERVYIAMGYNDDLMMKEVKRMTAAFKAGTRAPFQWHYAYFPKESHATILHRAVYAGFEWLHPVNK